MPFQKIDGKRQKEEQPTACLSCMSLQLGLHHSRLSTSGPCILIDFVNALVHLHVLRSVCSLEISGVEPQKCLACSQVHHEKSSWPRRG